MTPEIACQKYLELEAQCDEIDNDAKQKKAGLKTVMKALEQWCTLFAQGQGLENLKTPFGTAYWSVHQSCTTANPTMFKDFVIEKKMFDLLETRASKTGVKAYIDAYHEVPPGVDYKTVRVFNVRKPNEKE